MRSIYITCVFLATCSMAFCQKKDIELKSIGINNTIEFYTKPSRLNWNITSLEGSIRKDIDSLRNITLIPKLNFAQKVPIGENYFKNIDVQGQLDMYMSLSKRISLYGMYAYSGSSVFAKHLALTEGTLSLTKGWGIVGGIKMYYWTKPIFNYTLGFEKYIANLWINVKPSLTYINSNCYGSISIGIRNYFKDPLTFIHLGIYEGHSAEIIPHLDSQSLLGNKTWGAYFIWQQKISSSFVLKSAISFRNEQYSGGLNRNIPGVTIGFNYLF